MVCVVVSCDNAKPIQGIYTKSSLQAVYASEKREYEEKRSSLTQTIMLTALRKDRASRRMWKDAVKRRDQLDKDWEGRSRAFEATRESLR